LVLGVAGLLSAIGAIGDTTDRDSVANPHPVQLRRPMDQPLSALALLGRDIFFDKNMSASGQQACASCHVPAAAYGPPDDKPVQPGGRAGHALGERAVPGLRYSYRTPNFSIGPDNEAAENVDLKQMAAQAATSKRAQKVVGSTSSAVDMVPQGGLFWDGRVNTLQDQAMGPLFNPVEMANRDLASVAAKLKSASYQDEFPKLFDPRIFSTSGVLVDEAMFAVARFQIEDPSFHPYTSKYDYYLEGKAELSAAEARGLKLFEDKDKANCGGCHLDRPGKDGTPPLFTDYQFEALGVPRNGTLASNRNPRHFDLGVCGPVRLDLKDLHQYCGMFRTPTLRNTATRKVFFHNGEYHTLEQVLDFYALRDVAPDKIYPEGRDGKPMKFDDLPSRYRANADVTDPPFDRHPGQAPAISEAERRDLIAFLKTLNDGFIPGR
jgi:cytochrome c peroxidase